MNPDLVLQFHPTCLRDLEDEGSFPQHQHIHPPSTSRTYQPFVSHILQLHLGERKWNLQQTSRDWNRVPVMASRLGLHQQSQDAVTVSAVFTWFLDLDQNLVSVQVESHTYQTHQGETSKDFLCYSKNL